MLTFRPIVDTEEQASMLQDGIVRVLDGDNGKCTHMVNQLGDYKVYNEDATQAYHSVVICMVQTSAIRINSAYLIWTTGRWHLTPNNISYKDNSDRYPAPCNNPNVWASVITVSIPTWLTRILLQFLSEARSRHLVRTSTEVWAWITKAEAVQVVPPTVPSKKTQKQSAVGKVNLLQ